MNGTMQVSLWVIISQWILLFALGALLLVAYRQLGYILQLRDLVENSGSEKDGLSLGEKASVFRYHRTKGAASRSFDPQNRWSLLLFVDPGCVSCQNALQTLGRLAPKLRGNFSLLVVTSSEPALVETNQVFRSTSLEIAHVEKEVVHQLYQTNTTPFLYIIDQKGVVQAKGIASSEGTIQSIIRKVDLSFTHIPRDRPGFVS